MINYLLTVLMLFAFACNDKKVASDNTNDRPVVEEPAPAPAPSAPPVIEDPTPSDDPDEVDDEPLQTITTEVPAPTPANPSVVPAAPVMESSSFKANVKLIGATTKQTLKYNKAVVIALKVINSKEFQDKVKLISSFTSSKENGKQVMAKLLSGAESLSKEVDGEMDLGVKFYYANNSTVGYTNGSITYINVNTKFFDQYTSSSVAANLVHEYMHKLGYGHTSYYNLARDKSVPYLIGSTIRTMGKKYE